MEHYFIYNNLLVRLRESLSSLPQPLERLVAKCGPELGGSANSNEPSKQQACSPGRSSYRSNRKLQPDEVQDLVAQYKAGVSIAALARQFSMHTQTVDAHLQRQDVQKRSLRKLSDEQVERAVQLYGDGWSTTDLAAEFDGAAPTVRMTLIRAGVVLRSPGEGRWHTKRKTERKREK